MSMRRMTQRSAAQVTVSTELGQQYVSLPESRVIRVRRPGNSLAPVAQRSTMILEEPLNDAPSRNTGAERDPDSIPGAPINPARPDAASRRTPFSP